MLKVVTGKEITDSIADIHGLVYHHNINSNKVKQSKSLGKSTYYYKMFLERMSDASCLSRR